jgi:small subunit ribosomal protein S17
MDKTVTIRVDTHVKHPKYGKFVRKSKKYHAHDEKNDAHEGDWVEIIEMRKLSKNKTWRLVRIMERAK